MSTAMIYLEVSARWLKRMEAGVRIQTSASGYFSAASIAQAPEP